MSHSEDPERPPDDERVTYRRSDFHRMRRAAREQWGVPDRLQTEALFQAAKILASRESTPREKLAVMRFLDAAQRTDIAEELARTKIELERLKLPFRADDAGASDQLDMTQLTDEQLQQIIDRRG